VSDEGVELVVASKSRRELGAQRSGTGRGERRRAGLARQGQDGEIVYAQLLADD